MQRSPTNHSTAKLFVTGGSQAVRLPVEFRFEGVSELYVRRDASTGDLILSSRPPGDWRSFMLLREKSGPVPRDFLTGREQGNQQRDPFAVWEVYA